MVLPYMKGHSALTPTNVTTALDWVFKLLQLNEMLV